MFIKATRENTPYTPGATDSHWSHARDHLRLGGQSGVRLSGKSGDSKAAVYIRESRKSHAYPGKRDAHKNLRTL